MKSPFQNKIIVYPSEEILPIIIQKLDKRGWRFTKLSDEDENISYSLKRHFEKIKKVNPYFKKEINKKSVVLLLNKYNKTLSFSFYATIKCIMKIRKPHLSIIEIKTVGEMKEFLYNL